LYTLLDLAKEKTHSVIDEEIPFHHQRLPTTLIYRHGNALQVSINNMCCWS
jgi:hypothetical protein